MIRSCAIVVCSVCLATGPQVAAADPSPASVRLEIMQGRPVVAGVYVNGQGPFRFLLDTGSTLNHLESKVAEAIGLKPTFHVNVRSAIGATLAPGAGGVDVALGPVRADGQAFLFTGLAVVHQLSSDIHGILGQEFLSRFDYLIDVRSKRLTFGTRQAAGNGTRVPFRVAEGRPVLSTSLGWLVLDSGAHRMVRFGIEAVEMTQSLMTISGTVRVGTVFSRLLIDGRSFWDGDAVAVPRSAEAGSEGLLPTSLFKTVYVSNSEGYVVLD